MFTPDFLKSKFEKGLEYEAYLKSGKPDQLESWKKFERVAREHASLNSQQRSSLRDFARKIHVFVLSGLWCGDCVAQVPLIHIIADERPDLIQVRYLDRDLHMDLAEQVRICGGLRVPTVIFASEDFEFIGLAGDKSLSRLRALAAKALGASCPLPTAEVAHDEIAATLDDWLREIERVHLTLRLSPKLRQRHGD